MSGAAVFSCLFSACLAAATLSGENLEEGWENPPPSARPQVWWHWMNGNVTKAGITADLEAMAAGGIGGAHLFDIDYGIPPGPVAFNTESWFDHVAWAAKESRRLGLELTVCTGSGWCSGGGAWDKIEDGMKFTCWAETRVAGTNVAPIRPKTGGGRCYRDIAIIAYPTPAAESAPKIEEFVTKTFRFAFDNGYGGYHQNKNRYPGAVGGLVKSESCIDLTKRLRADGALDWTPPAGDWTILRLGFYSTGGAGYPQTQAGRGIEYDKLSKRAYDLHFDGYLKKLVERLGPLAGRHESGLTGVLLDSYEPGSQNWTEDLPEEFMRTMGYSMSKYYAVLGGRTVNSIDESERFLRDYRRVIANMFAHNFANRQVERCHALGLKVYHEPYGECAPADFLQFGRRADIPMTEFWAHDPEKDRAGTGTRVAAHIAHYWGQPIVAAESFTTWPQNAAWRQDPFAIKAWNDMSWCAGVNRIVYHSWVMQPWTDEHLYPGMTQGRFGVHFGRTVTWWPMAREWIRYQQRAQFLLQAGSFAPDVLVFVGDDAPLKTVDTTGRMKGSPSVQFDCVSHEGLAELKCDGGRLVAPSGLSYELLYLDPAIESVEEETMDILARLVASGARVAGLRPKRASGLKGYPAADGRVARKADEIWRRGAIAAATFDEAVAKAGIRPDCLIDGKPDNHWIHRFYPDGTHGYFVMNKEHRKAHALACAFRVRDLVPELWNPETGLRTRIADYREEDGYTKVTLPLECQGAAFVMLRPPEKATAKVAPEMRCVAEMPVTGAWQVSFPAGWNAPSRTVFDELVSWDTRREEGIRYFSGIATYRKTVKISTDRPDAKYVLDLGEVKNLARVKANGKVFPALWKPPFTVDVTEAVTGSVLTLEIDVANLWCNRLIGDENKPEDVTWETKKPRWPGPGEHLAKWPEWFPDVSKRTSGRLTFTTWHHWHKGDRTLPSGLLGPVKLRTTVLPTLGGAKRQTVESDL